MLGERVLVQAREPPDAAPEQGVLPARMRNWNSSSKSSNSKSSNFLLLAASAGSDNASAASARPAGKICVLMS